MKYLLKLLLVNAFVALAGQYGGVWAQSPGQLDPSFGLGAGKVEGIQLGTGDFFTSSVLIQQDGKVVVVGRCSVTETSSFVMCAARLNANGTRDMSYGTTNGEVSIDFGTDAYPKSAVIQADGKIVVVGVCFRNPDPPKACFARLSSSGRLDPTFNGPDGLGAGYFSLASSVSRGAYGVSLQPDGKIVVVGSCSVNGGFCVLRLLPDGTMDAGFGPTQTPGRRVIGSSFSSGIGRAVALLPNGQIMAAGDCAAQTGTGGRFCVSKLNADGSIDTSFVGRNSAGVGTGTVTQIDDVHRLTALVVQADMKPVLVGECLQLATCVMRLMPNGQIDSSFIGPTGASAGEVVFQTDGGYQFSAAASLQSDHKILLFGGCTYGNSQPCLARLLPDGSFDTSFRGPDGNMPGVSQFRLANGLTTYLSAPGIAIQLDDKILVAATCRGASTYQLCAARLLSGSAAQSTVKSMTEFRYTPLDYYFITSRDTEKTLLDGAAGWLRTGGSFNVLANSEVGSSPITRFYFDKVARSQIRGSHFYTALPDEVAAVQSLNPTNQSVPGKPVNEGVDSYAFRPTTAGTCAAGQAAVYRLFRGGTRFPDDPNHRFTTDLALYNSFVALGWDGEGIKFCVPQ
jgi:uncharacterized delta-60 repeat protein